MKAVVTHSPSASTPADGSGVSAPHVLLKNWLSVTESQICALEVLRTQLPEVKMLLESNVEDVSGAFSNIAAHIEDINKLAAQLATTRDEVGKEQMLGRMQIASGMMSNEIGRAIVGLQFQDRMSQNLVITINVLNAIIEYLQREIDATSTALDQAHVRSKLDEDFAKKLLTLLNLGDLQRKFVHHLLTHGYIENPAALGLSPDAPEKGSRPGDDDIDLF